MKYKKNILAGACLLLLLSCTDSVVDSSSSQDQRPEQESLTAGLPMGPRSGSKAGMVMPLTEISLSTLSSGINANLQALKIYKNNPALYTQYQSGVPYVNFAQVIGNPSFGYVSSLNLVTPPTYSTAVFPYDNVKADISNKLNQMNVGASFKTRLLTFFDKVRVIDYYTYQGFKNEITAQLLGIKLEQRSTPGYLIEIEKFALNQAFYQLMYIIESSYNNSSTSAPCLPQTREQWKAVGEAAFMGGLATGAGMGLSWAQAGAMATTAGGESSPWRGNRRNRRIYNGICVWQLPWRRRKTNVRVLVCQAFQSNAKL